MSSPSFLRHSNASWPTLGHLLITSMAIPERVTFFETKVKPHENRLLEVVKKGRWCWHAKINRTSTHKREAALSGLFLTSREHQLVIRTEKAITLGVHAQKTNMNEHFRNAMASVMRTHAQKANLPLQHHEMMCFSKQRNLCPPKWEIESAGIFRKRFQHFCQDSFKSETSSLLESLQKIALNVFLPHTPRNAWKNLLSFT